MYRRRWLRFVKRCREYETAIPKIFIFIFPKNVKKSVKFSANFLQSIRSITITRGHGHPLPETLGPKYTLLPLKMLALI